MDKYICNICKKTFNNGGISIDSESLLVEKLRAYCPFCRSYSFDLTEHGKLLIERQKKIEKLDELSKN